MDRSRPADLLPMLQRLLFGLAVGWSAAAVPLFAADAIASIVDEEIDAAQGKFAASPPAADGEILRRIHLDLAGAIPTRDEAAAYLADASADKYDRLVDRLLAAPSYARRFRDAFHVMWMERRGDDPKWKAFLEKAFAENLPFDRLCAAVLDPNALPPEEAPAAGFFLSKRLENYGQNPVDYPGLTRDVARLFLGKDLQCAQCHDHLFVNAYLQEDFQGLHLVFQNLAKNPKPGPPILEKPILKRAEFSSVFEKIPRETGPRAPGRPELEMVSMAAADAAKAKPDPKAKPAAKGKAGEVPPSSGVLSRLTDELVSPDHPAFAANAVNRVWFLLMGRGLVHPLDLHHPDNPASHPELLRRLAIDFRANGCDVRRLVRGIVLSQAYRRSSLAPTSGDAPPKEKFLTAIEKRLSAEQWFAAALVASGESARLKLPEPPVDPKSAAGPLWEKTQKAFNNPAGEAEIDFAPSLPGALLMMNDPAFLKWLDPQPGNRTADVLAAASADEAADRLFLGILTRLPTADERAQVAATWALPAEQRIEAVVDLAWSLLASTEFAVNH